MKQIVWLVCAWHTHALHVRSASKCIWLHVIYQRSSFLRKILIAFENKDGKPCRVQHSGKCYTRLMPHYCAIFPQVVQDSYLHSHAFITGCLFSCLLCIQCAQCQVNSEHISQCIEVALNVASANVSALNAQNSLHTFDRIVPTICLLEKYGGNRFSKLDTSYHFADALKIM